MFDKLPKWVISMILIIPPCVFIGNVALFLLGCHVSESDFMTTLICGISSIGSYHLAKDIFFKK